MTKKNETTQEQLIGKGEQAFKKLKELIKEGNIRKVIIKDKRGKSIAEFPLTIGVIGAAIVPVLAAIGAVVALVSECSISIEHKK